MSEHSPIGNDGVAIAHLALTVGLINRLKARGLLTDKDVEEMIDQALLGLEEMGVSGQTAAAAHAVLEQLLEILRPGRASKEA